MNDSIVSIEAFSLTQKRDIPYLGPQRSGETPNAKGYFVRQGNKTVYPIFDRSVLVKIKTEAGLVGWGETYGLVAPSIIGVLINDLLGDFVIGKDPIDPPRIYDMLYDLVRVRGYGGGFYGDALAAIDIALWDIAGKHAQQSVTHLLGGAKHATVPAYISGLPKATLPERVALAQQWQARGFNAFKFATPIANEGVSLELKTLRSALGEDAQIAVDMHWNQTSDQAIETIEAMAPYGLWFAEAPVQSEDIKGLEEVCQRTKIPIAVGEEWRTPFDMKHRISHCTLSIVQPEMGHVGITNFMRMGALADQQSLEVIPHATVGSGIFLAASLQASAALASVSAHEFQHSIFEPSRHLIVGAMACSKGSYTLPTGSGLGIEPSDEALSLLEPL